MKRIFIIFSVLLICLWAAPSFARDGRGGPKARIFTNISLPSNEQNTDPTATDDASKGYKVGDFRVNELTDTSWQCIDNTIGTAIWLRTGSVGRTITASETLTTADFGKTFTINSGSIVYVTLPDVTTANNDSWMRFKKYGAGGFYLRCAGAEESIGDSALSGGTVYNSSTETFANITLEVTSGVSWFITTFDGTWITP